MERTKQLWFALQRVKTLEFIAHSRSSTGWSGKGTGSVVVEVPTPESIVFRESGHWHPTTGKALEFRNAYRWSRSEDTVRLEHLRFGENHPVSLFDLAPDTDALWSSVAPHLCRNDEYTARLEVQDSGIAVQWRILGPEKDEEIIYRYHYLPV